MLKESRGLTLVDPYMAAYVPNQELKEFCDEEKEFFLTEQDFRLRPRGLMFDGASGTGKTQGAKYIANQWGVPLFRLSAGFMNKWVGDTENNFDSALKAAEAAAPCILLIDEIEKFFAGQKSGNSDSSGTMGRVMGGRSTHFRTLLNTTVAQ